MTVCLSVCLQVNVARDIASQMADVLEQRDFVGIVNVSYLAASTQPHMKPFMLLAETLGAMAAQLGGQEVCPDLISRPDFT